ncbi:MAG: TspO/MBR family protein [Halobacteria archaeon]|nr:TspO/MBR family protein [Halobacteria archaeon]
MTGLDDLRNLARERPLLTLVVSVLVVEVVGASGSVFTVSGLDWYATLQRPSLSPPNWVFGPVWTLLFALIGAGVWLVWRRAGSSPRKVRLALVVFAVHFVFNLGWSAAFFGAQNVGLGLLVIVVLWALIVVTIWAFTRVDRRAGLVLVPYLAWVSFAAYLNYGLWTLN